MIDASIPLQVQPAKYDDPSNQLMRILQIQGLQDARTKEQRSLDQQTAMNDAYSGALGSDGNLDRNKLYSLLAGKGQGSQIPAAQKTYADLDNKQSDTDKNKALATKDTSEAENKTIAMYRDASTAITDPVSAVEFVKHMHSDPRLANSAIARIPLEQALAQIPQDPNQLAAWKQQFALGATKFMELNKPQFITSNTGGKTVTTGVAGLTGQTTPIQSLQNTQSPDNAATNETSRANNAATVGATLRGQNLTDSRAREGNDIQREAARNQVLNDPTQGPMLIDKGTGTARPVTMGGARIPGEVPAKQKAAAVKTLPILDEADKLIDQATGSYVGAGVDVAARAVGRSPDGADAIAKLKVLEGQLMMSQPRMEGPQSDKDVQLYRQMAGKIGDPTVPASQKKAALSTIRDIQTRYAGGAQQPAGSGGGLSPAEQSELQQLRQRFKR